MTQTPTEYGALVSEMLRRAAVTRQPAHGAFELTSRCNLACRMCYVRQAAGDAATAAKEIPASAWLELARGAVDNGMVFLLLTGGEVFLRRDFFEIYEPLTRMGLSIALFTNGTLITKEIAARLAQAPPSRVEITLYGATAATCEAVTGRQGSLAACRAGIEALLSHRITFGLKTTVTRQNVGELEAMRQMAHDWGVPFSASWLLTRRPDLNHSDVEDCRLSAADCITLEETDSASAHDWTEVAIRETTSGRHGNFYCQGGKASFAINSVGEMNVCLLLPQPAVRPLEIGFPEAWKRVRQYVDSAPPAGSECNACEAFSYCGRCPAWSMVENGTLTDAVPYLCEIARARKDRYGQPA
ncbi:MAG: radical SAM protein [Syntrophobacteraceae bacterium]